MLHKLTRILFERRIIKEMYFNYISRKVRRFNKARIIIYKKSIVKIGKNATLVLKENLLIGKKASHDNIGFTCLSILNDGYFEVNGGILWSGSSINIMENGSFRTGFFHLNYNSIIRCYNDILFGEGVYIARNSFITDANPHIILCQPNKKSIGFIRIGNHVWFSSNVCVFKNTSIGDDCVIAANTIVSGKTISDKHLLYDKKSLELRDIDGWKA